MRFDAPEHVRTWQKFSRYPDIHHDIVGWTRITVAPSDGTVLDLCSSSGLLGRQLADCGYIVTAVQEPNAAVQLGLDAGVYRGIPLLHARIDGEALPAFLHWVGEQQVETVVARRAFPELWDALGADGFAELARGLVAAGVETIVLEGRAPTRKAVHPLASADAEVDALTPHGWRTSEGGKVVRVLRACTV